MYVKVSQSILLDSKFDKRTVADNLITLLADRDVLYHSLFLRVSVGVRSNGGKSGVTVIGGSAVSNRTRKKLSSII